MTLDPFKAIEITLGINPKAAKIAVGGFIVIALAIAAWQAVGDTTVTIWQMLGALVALMLLMIILSHFPTGVGRLCGWVIGLCFAIWALTLTGQVVANDEIPYVAPAKCIAYFGFADTCGRSRAAIGEAVVAEAVITADQTTSPAPETPRPAGQDEARVFIQFAGFTRETVVTLAAGLVDQGWRVEGADRGGERTGSAAGLNEIRFLNADDKALAEALALAVSAGLEGNPPIAVKDLSATRYGSSKRGTLEVWVSP